VKILLIALMQEDHWYNELGPMRIPKNHLLTRELVTRFNLSLLQFNLAANGYFVNRQLTPPQNSSNSSAMNGTAQSARYLMSSFAMFPNNGTGIETLTLVANALKEPLEDFEKLPWKEVIKKYDKYSLKSWLAKWANLTVSDVARLGIFNNNEPLIEQSLMEILIDECIFAGDTMFDYVVNGFDAIPRGFVPTMMPHVMLNSKVTAINQTDTQVTVQFQCRGVSCWQKVSVITADFAIVTNSGPTSAFIDFSPELSSKKQSALQSIGYTTAAKVLLAFQVPFWEREYGPVSINRNCIHDHQSSWSSAL
jgi:monoamine oxidase